MSQLIEHAKEEFRIAGWMDADGKFEDDVQEAICNNVLIMLKVFSEAGHSGSSAPYTVRLFEKLAMFEPITPLTGDDDEWIYHGDGMYQNKRYGNVFKNTKSGTVYDSEGKIFVTKDRGAYVSKESRVPVVFPYVPTKEYVHVE